MKRKHQLLDEGFSGSCHVIMILGVTSPFHSLKGWVGQVNEC
jgi:hypothetical protein